MSLTRVAVSRQWMVMSATSLVIAAVFASPAVLAQYKWKDERGRTVYSDTPPPGNTPVSVLSNQSTRENSHRNAPEKPAAASVPPNGVSQQNMLSSSANAAAAAAAAKAGPKSLAEQVADFNRRREEAEKKAQADRTEAELSKQRAEDCERMRSYQRSLSQGQRIMRTKPNGEREFLNDKQQAEETQKINQSVSQQCSS